MTKGDNPQFPDVGTIVPGDFERPARPSFAQRVERAQDLAARFPYASEILHFYACIAGQQESAYDHLKQASTTLRPDASSADSWPLNFDLVVPGFSAFAHVVAEYAPVPLRDRAAKLASADQVEQTQLMATFWNGGTYADPADHFVALGYLQPYAEWLAESGYTTAERLQPNAASAPDALPTRRSPQAPAHCPVCGSEALAATLRPQDLGARRSLVCSLCMNEWDFPRVLCPACGEDRFDSLAVYTAADLQHVRVDACDTCKHYIKTIDLTRDGHAIAVVDELATLPLDLWAREHEYTKLTPNLIGV